MKRTTIIATVAAAALLAGGTASALTLTNDSPKTTSTDNPAKPAAADNRTATTPDKSATPTTRTQSTPTLSAAMTAALKKQPGTVESVEYDHDPSAHWEFDILGKDNRWYDVDVTKDTVRSTPDDEDGDDARALRTAKVDAREAATTAAKSLPGKLTSVEFEDEHGRHFWEAESRSADGTHHELLVNAQTGTTAHPHPDDDEDD